VVAILSATLTIGVAQSVASRVLYGMGKLRLFARLALVEAGLNLALCFALVGPYGLEGVAVAVAIPNVLFCLFAICYACFVLESSPVKYLLASWLRPIAAVCVPAAVWWFATPVETTWPALAIGIGLGMAPYAIVVAGMEGAPRLAARSRRARSFFDRFRLAANSASS
jgi:O-antigen/teichoic acid export membrane protein